MPARRCPALVLRPAPLRGAAGLARRARPAAGAPADEGEEIVVDEVSVDDLMPTVDAPEADASTWYCASGTGSGNSAVSRQLVLIANTTEDPRAGNVTVFPDECEPVGRAIEIAPRSRVVVNTGEIIASPSAAALVEVDGGGVAVSQFVEGTTGKDVSECATTASSEWHVASGATTADAALFYAIFNPFPDEAIVDMTFDTDDGSRNPEAFQGFLIPGGSVRFVDVGAVVTRRNEVAASITARTGRVVVDRIQSYGGQEGISGLSVSLAEPTPSETWFFPAGPSGEGVNERYVIYNPTDESATVDLEVALDDPATNGGIEPFELTIPRRDAIVLATSDEGWNHVPDVGHSVVVRSLNGVPVVTERTLIVQDPAASPGISTTAGTPLIASTWVLPSGDLQAAAIRSLSIQNPLADARAQVTVTALVDGEALDLTEVEVVEGQRLTLALDELSDRESYILVVDSSSPVVVEEGYRFDDPGERAVVRAVPLLSAAELPAGF
jgi:hypothetical protein